MGAGRKGWDEWREQSINIHTLSYVKQIAHNGIYCFHSGSSNWCPMTDKLEGWDGVGGEREGSWRALVTYG